MVSRVYGEVALYAKSKSDIVIAVEACHRFEPIS